LKFFILSCSTSLSESIISDLDCSFDIVSSKIEFKSEESHLVEESHQKEVSSKDNHSDKFSFVEIYASLSEIEFSLTSSLSS